MIKRLNSCAKMKIHLTKFKHVLPVSICLLVIAVAISIDRVGNEPTASSTSKELPLLELSDKATNITAYHYLGSWALSDGFVKSSKGKAERLWRDTVRLTYDDSRKTFHIEPSVPLLKGSVPQQMTPDTEAEIYNRIGWRDNQVSLFAFRALSPSKQVAVAEIDTESTVALYINGKFVREVSADGNVELGTTMLIPVDIEAGENVVTLKIFSSEGQPHLRMSLILDQSKDFQAALSRSWGFLRKLIYSQVGDTFELPVITWDARLSRMTVGVEIHDVLNGKDMFKIDATQRGATVRDGNKILGEGIYKITYKSNQPEQETFEEYFLVGDPKKMAETLTGAINELPWKADEKLNVDAQLRRAEILFRGENYTPMDRSWAERILFTLGNLAEFINLKKAGSDDIFNGLTGLRLMGFISKVDNSKQFYRLFVPSHKAGEKLPLVVVMPTSLKIIERPFLESPFVASHRDAIQISKFAEKYGFAVLWPGYKSAPKWWTYEAAHVEAALEDVEKRHSIDSSRVSLYGTCDGGFHAGRMASTYPNRFAAIVYDRAYFDRYIVKEAASSVKEWIQAINPSDKIIANRNIKVFVLNDGSRGAHHGEIAISREFLGRALQKRSDIKFALGPRALEHGLWNSIFEFLTDCKNEHPDCVKADIPAASGFAGPISEVFATPFIVVEGTHVAPEEAKFMDAAIKNLKAQYRDQFFDATFRHKKDTEITDDEIEKYSLVLVGNAESNAVWSRLAAKYAGSIAPYDTSDDQLSSSTASAFAEVFKNPANNNNYLLLIGADKLSNMALLGKFDPFNAWYDCYINKSLDGVQRERIFAHRQQNILSSNQQQ